MMKVIDNRFAAREEQWGMILQDLKYDRMCKTVRHCVNLTCFICNYVYKVFL